MSLDIRIISGPGQQERGGRRWGQRDWLDDLTQNVGAFTTNALDSLSLGWGDELMGVGAGALNAIQGRDFWKAYDEQAERSRKELEEARFWNPEASFLGALGGGLAFGGGLGLGLRGLGAANMLRNMNVGHRIFAGAGSGGLAGGAYGAGSAPGDRLGGAIDYAIPGALFGGALQGGGELLGHAWRTMGRTAIPQERAAIELAKSFERTGMTPAQFQQRVGDLRQLEQQLPGSNPMVMDALGKSGTDAVMGAATRPSAARNRISDALEERNRGARERVTTMLWGTLNGSGRGNAAKSIVDLEDIQKTQAAPLYAEVYRGNVGVVPAPVRKLMRDNDDLFGPAQARARQSAVRVLGADASQEAIEASPLYWHRLLEHVQADVGAQIQAAKMDPLGAARGPTIAEITQAAQAFNGHVRRMLGPKFQQAQNIFAGAARNKDAVELGRDAVSAKGDIQLGQLARRMDRMTQGEKETARMAALTELSDLLEVADTGTGKVNVLRSVIGNASKKRTLEFLFGGEKNFQSVMRALEYEQELFTNTVNTGIRVNSITADKYFANNQMFAPNQITGIRGRIAQALGRDAKEQQDEQLANSVLQLMMQPVSSANAPNAVAAAQQQGLLARAFKEAERMRNFRARAGINALGTGATGAIGFGG